MTFSSTEENFSFLKANSLGHGFHESLPKVGGSLIISTEITAFHSIDTHCEERPSRHTAEALLDVGGVVSN